MCSSPFAAVLSDDLLSEVLLSDAADELSVLPPQPANITAVEQTSTAAKNNAKNFFIKIHLLSKFNIY
jgi:hypothetical protein